MRFVFRNFPLQESHPHAEHAAEAAEAAGAQGKFWEMHHALFEHQKTLDDRALEEYASSLDARRRALLVGARRRRVRRPRTSGFGDTGVRSGVNGTPTFFVNGMRYDGAVDERGGVRWRAIASRCHGAQRRAYHWV